MEAKLTGQRCFLRKPGLSLLSKHLRRPEAEKSGPEGLPWKGLLVLRYASTKRSFDGTQGCGIKRFTVSWLQQAPVSRCPQASETGRQLSLASQPLKVSPALCPLSLLTFTLQRSRPLFHRPPSCKGWKGKLPRTPLLGTIPGHSGALLPTTLRIVRTNQHRGFRIRRESMSVLPLQPLFFESPEVLKRQVSFTLTASWKTARAGHHRSCLSVHQLPLWPDGAGHGWGHHLPARTTATVASPDGEASVPTSAIS